MKAGGLDIRFSERLPRHMWGNNQGLLSPSVRGEKRKKLYRLRCLNDAFCVSVGGFTLACLHHVQGSNMEWSEDVMQLMLFFDILLCISHQPFQRSADTNVRYFPLYNSKTLSEKVRLAISTIVKPAFFDFQIENL